MTLDQYSPEEQEQIKNIIENGEPEVLQEEDCGKKNYDPNGMDWDKDKRQNLFRPLVEVFTLGDESVTVTTTYMNDANHASVFNYTNKDYSYASS